MDAHKEVKRTCQLTDSLWFTCKPVIWNQNLSQKSSLSYWYKHQSLCKSETSNLMTDRI